MARACLLQKAHPKFPSTFLSHNHALTLFPVKITIIMAEHLSGLVEATKRCAHSNERLHLSLLTFQATSTTKQPQTSRSSAAIKPSTYTPSFSTPEADISKVLPMVTSRHDRPVLDRDQQLMKGFRRAKNAAWKSTTLTLMSWKLY